MILRDITKYKNAIDKLSESEKKYRFLTETTLNGIFIHKDGVLVECNQALLDLTGYSRQEAIGFNFFNVLSSPEARTEILSQVKKKHAKPYVINALKKNGSAFIAEIEGHETIYNGEKVRMVSVKDVTEREQTKKALENEKENYRTLSESARHMIIRHQLDGKIIYANQYTLDFFDVSKEQFFGTDIKKLISPQENVEHLAKVGEFNSGNTERSQFEIKVKLKNGEVRYLDAIGSPIIEDGKVSSVLVTAYDISERKNAEQKILESRSLLSNFIEHFPDDAWTKDKEGRLTMVNRFMKEVTLQHNDFIGKSAHDIFPHEIADVLWETEKQVLKSGKTIITEEKIPGLHGIRDKILTKFPLLNSNNEIIGLGAVAHDITERNSAEREAKRSANLTSALLESLSFPTFYKDCNGRYTGCNKAFENFHGISAATILQKTVDEVFDGDWARKKRKIDLKTIQKQKGDSFEFDILDKDGIEKRVLYSESIVYDENNQASGIIGSFMDISTRVQKEKLRAAQLSLVERSLSQNVSEIVKSFLDKAESLTNSKISFYHFISDDQEHIQVQGWSENTTKSYCAVNDIPDHYPISKAGVWVDCVSKKKPVIHNDYASLPHKQGLPEGHATLSRELVVPVFRGDKIKAIFGVGNKDSDYTDFDVEIVQQMADFAWEIIDRKMVQEELLRSEEKVLENEEKHRFLFENMTQGVAYHEHTGKISYANNAASEILGLSINQLTGKVSFDSEWVSFKEDGSPYPGKEHPNMVTLRTGKPVRNAVMGIYSPVKQKRIWININSIPKFKNGESLPYQVVTIFNDITDTKEANIALELSENRYRNLFENTPIALWEEDLSEVLKILNDLKRKGHQLNEAFFEANPDILERCAQKIKIIDVNQATLQSHQAESKEELFAKLPELLTDSSLNALSKWLVSLAGGKTRFSSESKSVTMSGEVRDTFISTHLDKESSIIIMAVMDTTELKKAEKEIRRYQLHLEELVQKRTEALEESNREMEAFSYSVSHDLRAPLRAISGFASYLEEDYSTVLDEEGNRQIKVIQENAEKMDSLITDLLKLSRTSRAELEYVALNMKALALSMYMEVATENEQKEFELVIHDIPDARGDSTSIKQLWTNIIGNAIKYSARSARKEIEIGSIMHEPGYDTYYVKDRGVGFNEHFKDKIFATFKRLHNDAEFKGSGIGMAIAKRVMDKHNGKIWAENHKEGGAIFYFSLPQMEVSENEFH